MFVDWNLLVRDRETGKAVWVVSGMLKFKTLWTATVMQDIQPHVAKIAAQSNITKEHGRTLLLSMRDHGFSKVYSLRNGRVRWYKTPQKVDTLTTTE